MLASVSVACDVEGVAAGGSETTIPWSLSESPVAGGGSVVTAYGGHASAGVVWFFSKLC